MKMRSLSTRLFVLSLVWTVLALAAILFFIVSDYRRSTERAFNELLAANLYNLMGASQVDGNGQLTTAPDFGDPRYTSINSGWYWFVQEVGNDGNSDSSTSAVDQVLAIENAPPFNDQFQRSFRVEDIVGNELQVVEARAFLGEGDNLFNFRVTGNRSELEEDISAFTARILWLFLAFGLGLVAISYLVVRLGLSPLRETSARLAAIRNGEADRLDGQFPLEIQPLIDETNELIKANRRVVERAQTQVGNLAHGLKTPIAVIQNETASKGKTDAGLIAAQTKAMQAQIQTYLDRARISAQSTTAISRTEIEPVVERLIRVMKKLNPHLEFSSMMAHKGLVFAGEAHDLEELLGNLFENAARFAESRVQIDIRSASAEANRANDSGKNGGSFVLLIEDDGKGMSPEECTRALKRGARLDESMPGSGLGLAIVNDMVQEYGGSVSLDRSSLGGLAVKIMLPARN